VQPSTRKVPCLVTVSAFTSMPDMARKLFPLVPASVVLRVLIVAPVGLLRRRIESASRAEFGKLHSLDQFRQLNQIGAFLYSQLPDSGLSIDTSQMSPSEAARKICDFFTLEEK